MLAALRNLNGKTERDRERREKEGDWERSGVVKKRKKKEKKRKREEKEEGERGKKERKEKGERPR